MGFLSTLAEIQLEPMIIRAEKVKLWPTKPQQRVRGQEAFYRSDLSRVTSADDVISPPRLDVLKVYTERYFAEN